MNKFIKQMLEHGAMADQAGSEEERQLIIKDVEILYNKHIEEFKKQTIESLQHCNELIALLSFHGYNNSTEIYNAKRHIDNFLEN